MHTLAQLRAGELHGLKRIQISEQLTEFPVEILELGESLEILDLGNNQLSALPQALNQLPNLKILFLTNNHFESVPEVLASCPKLEMISFKANKLKNVPEGVFPKQTRWLILTENAIEQLPESMGELTRLQKFAMAGNQLTGLPASMENCKNLELIRLSANQLREFPDFLLQLPRLSWLAFSGNPFCEKVDHIDGVADVTLQDFELAHQLGEGASGVIHHGTWTNKPASITNDDNHIAVKLFKGDVTSDGYPRDELNCCLIAGEHPNLIKVVAQLSQPDQLGLVMDLIPTTYKNLGLPPSLASCTRDTFEQGTAFTSQQILTIANHMASALAHLHANQVSHGDIYAHNTMINEAAHVLFGDFGAASHLSSLSVEQQQAMEAIEMRSFGCLMDDLLANVACNNSSRVEALKALSEQCMAAETSTRPSFKHAASILQGIK